MLLVINWREGSRLALNLITIWLPIRLLVAVTALGVVLSKQIRRALDWLLNDVYAMC